MKVERLIRQFITPCEPSLTWKDWFAKGIIIGGVAAFALAPHGHGVHLLIVAVVVVILIVIGR